MNKDKDFQVGETIAILDRIIITRFRHTWFNYNYWEQSCNGISTAVFKLKIKLYPNEP